MKKIPEIYPVVTVTIFYLGPRPKSRKPTSVLVKVELHEGEEIHDLSQMIHHLEHAIETLRDHIKMYKRWQAQEKLARLGGR